jgi:peptidoglycan/LPS O-acetylase OafA/YrhL
MENIHSKRIVELDALRGLAALFVVVFHFTHDQDIVKYGFKFGITGVDLFFMISGFVILLTLNKTDRWQDFIINRFSRLFPVYWTCVTFTAILKVVSYVAVKKSLATLPFQYLANMTMFQLYFGQENIDGTYWTMIVEMLFYILMLFVFVSNGLKNIQTICFFILVPVALYAFIPIENYPVAHEWISKEIPIVNHFPLFFSGILFYKLKFDRKRFLPYLLLAFCFVVQFYLFDDGGRSKKWISHPEYALALTIYFAFFVLYVNNFLSFIVNKATIFLGAISYSLYLIHEYIGHMIIYQLMSKGHVNFWVASFMIALPIVIMIAWTINRFIEKPAMLFMREKFLVKRTMKNEPQLVTKDS